MFVIGQKNKNLFQRKIEIYELFFINELLFLKNKINKTVSLFH